MTTPTLHKQELIGHLGSDPEPKTLPGRSFPSPTYDHTLDDFVPTTVTVPERQFRTASFISTNFADGTQITHTLVDFEDNLSFYRKGAWIGVCGYFQTRQDGEQQTIREFIVNATRVISSENLE